MPLAYGLEFFPLLRPLGKREVFSSVLANPKRTVSLLFDFAFIAVNSAHDNSCPYPAPGPRLVYDQTHAATARP